MMGQEGELIVQATVFFNSLAPQERMSLIVLVLQVLFLVMLLIVGFRLKKLLKRYRLLLTGKQVSNLEGILLDLGERMKSVEERLDGMKTNISQMEQDATECLQRWALQRYKAFTNVGGDQSFTLVLLDRKGDGIMLSSIYGRDESRVYAKSISSGKANYPLSDDEQEVLAAAIQGRR
ncbi:MAG TPA: hypothetical protein DDZ55_08100 [Firmicutes bacterium]|nr:hypothetical protein [Bacillota bacterium]